MRTPVDLQKHQSLVAELLEIFLKEGFVVSGADGVNGFSPPVELGNDGYGDQKNKSPDVYAYDEHRQCYVIGEAKTGAGDFETEHALTQYCVFLDQFHSLSRKQSLLYVIVPSTKVAEFNTLITHYMHPDYWKSVVLVSSTKWEE